MEPAAPPSDFRVGDWLVEPGLNRVTRGQQVQHLRPRLLDLLGYLAPHAGRVVTKDEILERVWRQRFVAESVLSRSVADIRRLLDDEASQPRVIETIPKRGYRLLARVTPFQPRPAATPVPAPPRPSIVVLPVLDLAPGRDQEYFCDGLAEELTNRLAHLRGLRVVARTSAFAFKGKAADAREIGRRLEVGALLEGSVQRAGDRVRVTVQLIDAQDGGHIWSGRFDRPGGDIFAIEDEIAQAVTSELRVKLLGGAEARVTHRQTSDPAAHDLYLRGRHRAARRNLEDLEQAIRCYERAIALDPGYAAAHAGIGECFCVIGFSGLRRPADVFPTGRAAAERALAIDPGLVEGHAVLAHEAGMYEWDWARAERHFVRALELSPGYALTRVWYSHLLSAFGRFEEAITQAERACECDPLAPTVRMTLGLALYYARQFDRAVDCYRQVLATDPSFGFARFHLGRAYRAQGKFDAAAEQYRLVTTVMPIAFGMLAGVLRSLGRDEEAARAAAELERFAKTRYVNALGFASAYWTELPRRLRWLERAFDEREGTVPLLNVDPALDDLRSTPAFVALLDRLGLPRVERSA